MNDNLITLTDAAVLHIQKIIERRGSGIAFRLSVKQTGCSGYMYQPEVIEDIIDTDYQLDTPQGLKVCIEPACLEMIKGTVIDYVKKSLGQQQLVFNNPNVGSECGCGESFLLKEVGNNE